MSVSILLSTSLVPLPAPAPDLLEHWRGSACGLTGMALDPRLPLDLGAELARLARRAGLRCAELGHAWRGPSPASADRAERRAAGAALAETIEVAARGEVRRVLLAPSLLPLRPDREELARAFARGEPLELARLEADRAAVAARALDGLASVLEPCLRQAEAEGQELVLPWPAPWPHAFPRAAEVEALSSLFAGAPLAACLALDWIDVGLALRPGGEPERCQAPLASVRVADSCGLSQRLPLGSGEGRWRERLHELAAPPALDRVLTLRPGTRLEEVERSLALLEDGG